MGCPNSSQLEVPNEAGDEGEDGAETLSLCDLPLYGDEGEAVKCDRCPSSMSSDEECDLESFEFSSRELGSAFTRREEKIIFCGRIIHSKEQGCTAVRLAKSPGKDRSKKDEISTIHAAKRRRRLFRWKLGLFRKPRTGYRKMKQQRRQQRRMDSRVMKGKRYFLMFGLARFPVEMGLRDIEMRESGRTNQSTMFGLLKHTEAEIDGKKARSTNSRGLLNILRFLNCGKQSWPSESWE